MLPERTNKADTRTFAEEWSKAVEQAFLRWERSGDVIASRRRLGASIARVCAAWTGETSGSLVLAFGSLGRGERFSDIDLLVVDDRLRADHWYDRRVLAGLTVDLNLVSRAWIERAWSDPAWGYWLTESYVLHASNAQIENSWRRSVNRYWSLSARKSRFAWYQTALRDLSDAAYQAHSRNHLCTARFVLVERHRLLLAAAIDRFATRQLSHREVNDEFVLACEHGSLPDDLRDRIIRPLWSAHTTAADLGTVSQAYSELRREVSAVLRDPNGGDLFGIRPDLSTPARVRAFCALGMSDSGDEIETALTRGGATDWLPAWIPLVESAAAGTELLRLIAPRQAKPLARLLDRSPGTDPRLGSTAGARWIETNGLRTKLIVNTGGCKTASCSFCALPQFANATRRRRLAHVVQDVLAQGHVTELALYNDGSLLNLDEVPKAELDATLDVIMKHGVERLWIESIPRFITPGSIENVIGRSGARLTIGMGLQAIGDWYSISELGRPDVDALFGRAIDVIHDAGAAVRLFLLWGFPCDRRSSWSDRLGASLTWAQERSVDLITICPYQGSQHIGTDNGLCDLRAVLEKHHGARSDNVSVSIPERSSCSSVADLGSCAGCLTTLRAGAGADHATHPCSRTSRDDVILRSAPVGGEGRPGAVASDLHSGRSGISPHSEVSGGRRVR